MKAERPLHLSSNNSKTEVHITTRILLTISFVNFRHHDQMIFKLLVSRPKITSEWRHGLPFSVKITGDRRQEYRFKDGTIFYQKMQIEGLNQASISVFKFCKKDNREKVFLPISIFQEIFVY